MEIDIYYIFMPTPALLAAARAAGAEWLAEPEACRGTENDRTGESHTRESVELAFWTVFRAKLLSEGEETDKNRPLRQQCNDLGFSGCWSLYVVRSSGDVEDLLEEARDLS